MPTSQNLHALPSLAENLHTLSRKAPLLTQSLEHNDKCCKKMCGCSRQSIALFKTRTVTIDSLTSKDTHLAARAAQAPASKDHG